MLCVHNLKKMSKSTGFQVKEVNNSNLADYLDTATLLRIEYTLKNAKLIVYPQTKSDLVRLALLYKYGGVYLDASIIAV
jgi:mannosyltransferase OCH1-like enzyme